MTADDSRASSGSVFFFGLINDVPFDLAGPAVEENLAATPEPATLLLLGTSLAGMAGAAWKRRKAARSTD